MNSPDMTGTLQPREITTNRFRRHPEFLGERRDIDTTSRARKNHRSEVNPLRSQR